MIELRPYQTDVKHDIYRSWQSGHRNVLGVLPTGAGKTILVSEIFREHRGAAVAIAHRQELVSQISLALAQQGVYHNLIAARKTVKFICNYHSQELGRSYFHPQAPVIVAGVDTLLRRDLGSWAQQVTLWMQDEGHHVLRDNKWGKAAAMFPNARGLGVTATPIRSDGKGLGAHAQGLYENMVEGPSMRDLITMGNLTDYRIFAPPSDFDLSQVSVSTTTGEFNPHQLRSASKKSHIVGDVVQHYIRIACGKLGITFAVDVETAIDIASQYRASGIPAEVISAKTPDHIRVELLNRFRRREILQLVNVDLFGEGFDLPAIEVVSMARPTQSKALFIQQFGRALRPLDGKSHAIIIDHVGNVARHGLPDALQNWSLDARERTSRGSKDDTVQPVTACTKCMSIYERHLTVCPFCGAKPEILGRDRPEQVDGNLFELSPDALAKLRGSTVIESPAALKSRMAYMGASDVAINGALKHRRNQIDTLTDLKDAINWWGAHREAAGDTRENAYKRFFVEFGTDVLSAQSLPRKDAAALTERIRKGF